MHHLQTDFLFPRMDWITGAGSVMNLAGTYYLCNLSDFEAEADSLAVFSDWSMVGEDLGEAFHKAFREADIPVHNLVH